MFTERAFEESKSTCNKGLEFERIHSINIHHQGIPLLVSEDLLRKRGLGQIDLAVINKNHIKVFELKKSLKSLSFKHISWQKERLQLSCELIRGITGKEVTLVFYSDKTEKLGNWFLS